MNKWINVCVRPGTPVEDVLRRIDESALQIALVVDDSGHLLGTVTDGDVRRAILRGVKLQEPVDKVMNPKPSTASPADSREMTLASMRSKQIHHLPVVDSEGRMVGLETLGDLLSVPSQDSPVVLMAGGLGRRLAPLTDDCPKPMISVGCRPILETILLNFIEHGFHKFYFAVNHKADVIIDHFGDGSAWNVEIEYIRESTPLGTAGAVALIPERPRSTFIVMNGDILTKVNLSHLLDFHRRQGAAATMCVREYEFQVPYGVVKMKGQAILKIEEKPLQKYFVSAGIYAFEPEVIDHIPTGRYFDVTSLFDRLIEIKKTTAVFPLLEYWLDIGRHSDLALAQGDFDRFFR